HGRACHGRTLRESCAGTSVIEDYLTLLDWRRRVADLYSEVRMLLPKDAPAARARWRECRDELFRDHPQSALPAAERAGFRGLPYYPYDPRFAFTAAVRPLPEER